MSDYFANAHSFDWLFQETSWFWRMQYSMKRKQSAPLTASIGLLCGPNWKSSATRAYTRKRRLFYNSLSLPPNPNRKERGCRPASRAPLSNRDQALMLASSRPSRAEGLRWPFEIKLVRLSRSPWMASVAAARVSASGWPLVKRLI
jgi:hypothetical protein